MKTIGQKSILSALIIGLWIVTSFLMQGCIKSEDAPPSQPVAYVSIYQGSPDAPEVDVHLDGQKINSLPIKYGSFSGYLNFLTGERTLKITPANASNVLVDSTVNFQQNKTYSLFAVNTADQLDLIVLEDTINMNDSNKAGLRFVHVSPDADTVNIIATKDTTSATLFTNLSFKGATNFTLLNSGTYTFNLKNSSDSTNVLTIPDVNLTYGRIYTIVIRGFKNPPSGNTNTLSGQVLRNY